MFFPSGVNTLLWYVYVYTWIQNKWCDSVPDTYKLQPPGKDRVPWMSIFSAVKFSFIFYFMYMYNRLWIFISQINDSIRPRTVIVTVALLSGTLFFFLIWTVIGICQMFNGPFSYLRVVGKIWTVTEGCKFVLLSITLLSFCKHYFHGPDIKNFTMINISSINYMKETQLLHSSMMH